jgi:hypothetical protein
MEDDPKQRESRTKRLRDRMAEHAQPQQPDEKESSSDDGPREGESPLAYTERRMRETIRKKPQ